MKNLIVDPKRLNTGKTNIYVRAWLNDEVDSYDIYDLNLDSLYVWLQSKGDKSTYAEDVVAILLGHRLDR